MYKYAQLILLKSEFEVQDLKDKVSKGELHPKKLKESMAKDLVEIFYSKEEADKAAQEFERVFVKGGLPDEIKEVYLEEQPDLWICKVIVEVGFAPSNSQARRLVESRAVELDGTKVEDSKYELPLSKDSSYLLKVGKKNFAKILVR